MAVDPYHRYVNKVERANYDGPLHVKDRFVVALYMQQSLDAIQSGVTTAIYLFMVLLHKNTFIDDDDDSEN